jgi:hypothetical protein
LLADQQNESSGSYQQSNQNTDDQRNNPVRTSRRLRPSAFLRRTGILHRFDADHAYGSACYRRGGCADIIETVAHRIDASAFNPAFPAVFPRFVQHAVWRYCAQSGLDVCNGNRIDDSRRCENKDCRVRLMCDRVALR